MSREIIGTLTSYKADDDITPQLVAIATRQDEIFSNMLAIVDFFNNVYNNGTADAAVVAYQVNTNRIVSVVYNNSIIEITYKTLDNEERVIRFKAKSPNNTVEVETGPVIQVVNKYCEDNADFDNLIKSIGDVIYVQNEDLIYLVISEDGIVKTTTTLENKVLYLYDNIIYYKTNEGQGKLNLGGGSSDIEFEENFGGENYQPTSESSTKAVSASDVWYQLQKIWNAISGDNDPINPYSFDEEFEVDANGNSFKVFDYTTGNVGAFKFDKPIEEITAEEVDKAITLRLPYGYKTIYDVPVIDVGETGKGIWTAAKIGLQEGSTNQIGQNNRERLQLAIDDPNCIGFKLDTIYSIYGKIYYNDDGTSADKKLYNPNNLVKGDHNVGSFAESYVLELTKDTIITGEVKGEVVGGFYAMYGGLLYTENSLYLHKTKIINHSYNSNTVIFIDTEVGIDSIQVIGCEFTSDTPIDSKVISNVYPKGFYMTIYSPHILPYELNAGETENQARTSTVKKRVLKDVNYLNHLYIKGCSFQGGYTISSGARRFVKSCRIIYNTYTEPTGPVINLGLTNGVGLDSYIRNTDRFVSSPYTYGGTNCFMSCPIYIVGNKFYGYSDRVYKGRHDKADYLTPALIESKSVYMLHNYIENFISGRNFKSASSSENLETYDAYLSCMEVYYANNDVKNIISFNKYPISSNEVGICKGKNSNETYVYGGDYSDTKLCRCYKNNKYTTDGDFIRTLWSNWLDTLNSAEAGTYLQAEIDYDNALFYDEENDKDWINIFNRIISVSFANECVSNNNGYKNALNVPIYDEYVFSNNIVTCETGSIVGQKITGTFANKGFDDWSTAKVDISNNKFIAKYFERNTIGYTDNTSESSPKLYLFKFAMFRKQSDFNETVVNIANNEFECCGVSNGNNLNFVNFSFSESGVPENFVSEIDGDIKEIKNNIVTYDVEDTTSKGKIRTLRRSLTDQTTSTILLPDYKIRGLEDTSIDSVLEIINGTLPNLGYEPPAQLENGSKYIKLDDGEATVMEYVAPLRGIVSLALSTYIKSSVTSGGVAVDILTFSIPLSSTENAGNPTKSELKDLLETLDETDFTKFAIALGQSSSISVNDLKTYIDNATNINYTVNSALEIKEMLYFVLRAKGYIYLHEVNSQVSSTKRTYLGYIGDGFTSINDYAGYFDTLYSVSDNRYYIRICPKSIDGSSTYLSSSSRNASFDTLYSQRAGKPLVNNTDEISAQKTNSTAPVSEEWNETDDRVGLKDIIAALREYNDEQDITITKVNTSVTSLIPVINTILTAEDMTNIEIASDGTIREQQTIGG